MLEKILNEDIWNEFLIYKTQNSHLPKKEIKYYQEYIHNKKYIDICNKILNNNYKFSIPKKIIISKMGKNKKRVVYSFNEDETMVLKLISYLMYKYDNLFEDNLYSFRKNNGVKNAIYNLTKKNNITNKYAYKVDISNYFNSINISSLLKNLKDDLNDICLYNLIEKILENDKCIYNSNIISEKKGVMAGVPISAFLANYYLKDIDSYFRSQNVIYLRYADDIILFANSKEELNTLKDDLINKILEKDLIINKNKEFIYSPGNEIEFLGFSIYNKNIDLSKNTIKKIKGKIRRSARGIRRWMIKNNAKEEYALKAMNRKFNNKFFGKENNDMTWKYWFFPCINTDKSLKIVDEYMQQYLRYIITGKHNKKNYEKVPYLRLKECNYKSLVSEYYKFKNEKNNI